MPDATAFWSVLKDQILPLLDEEDDPDLWVAAVDTIYSDAAAILRREQGGSRFRRSWDAARTGFVRIRPAGVPTGVLPAFGIRRVRILLGWIARV